MSSPEDMEAPSLGLRLSLENGIVSANGIAVDGFRADFQDQESILFGYTTTTIEMGPSQRAPFKVGLEVPWVYASIRLDDDRFRTARLGDASVYLATDAFQFDKMRFSGELRYKSPTGTQPSLFGDPDEVPTGDGFQALRILGNLDVELLAGLGFEFDLAYLARFGIGASEFQPGDFISSRLALVFDTQTRLLLGLTFDSAFEFLGDAPSPLGSPTDELRHFATLGLYAAIPLGRYTRLRVEWGASQIFQGLLLRRGGYLLSGNNVFDAYASFNVAAEVAFR
ncbi:MAG: hypothetical protein AAFQ65_01915 [Myxococcota bacterium]